MRPPCAADRYTCPPAGRQHLYRTRLNKSGSIHCHPEQGVSDVEPNARTGVPAAPAGSKAACRPVTFHDLRPHRARRVSPAYQSWSCCFGLRSEEHTSELQSLMRISYAVFCLKKKNDIKPIHSHKDS